LTAASRGEIWFADLSPTRGHEQSGRRPCLILSVDPFNHGPADLHVVLPLTTKEKHVPLHVAVDSTESGLKQRCFIKCEDIRSIARERLVERRGSISAQTMAMVEDRVQMLLGL
jgi:mRNA interferase MazF